MADPKQAFILLMRDEDSKAHPGVVTREPSTHRCNNCQHEVRNLPQSGHCSQCGSTSFTDIPQRARLGINSFAHPEMPAEFWTADYAVALPMAEEKFKAAYWDVMRLDSVRDQSIANKLANIGYNAGTVPVVEIVQRFLGLDADGNLGPRTLDAVNTRDPGEIIQAIREGAAAYYTNIVARHPEKQEWLKDWLQRAKE